ncbi:hypothetical protein N1031_18935 [Herbiconiux moechotypicola]|uniref:Uncharacterized protein n=1 Tax=Herbiconiux moechotypicola TaxID=637393 RepID=A0ABP5R0B1_9MICO|nr:hypothetical protein [Herbiconiux moechotypicola]MCS5731836.1 hypothetical protein [Herbiconiux moechotypicola]
MFDPERRSTVDIDAQLSPRLAVLGEAAAIGARHGWPDDWLNDAAAQFIPAGFGARDPEWQTVYDDGRCTIAVGSAEMLLAMKLLAAQRRGMREFRDLAVLLDASGVMTVEAAEELFDGFYPGDGLTPRTIAIVEDALASGHVGTRLPVPPLG